eukprot:363331-Chlamydomonas_euryale.AAC.8
MSVIPTTDPNPRDSPSGNATCNTKPGSRERDGLPTAPCACQQGPRCGTAHTQAGRPPDKLYHVL